MSSAIADCDDTVYQQPRLSEMQHAENVDYYSRGHGGRQGPPHEVALHRPSVSFGRALAEGQPADGTTWQHATQIVALGEE